MSVAQLLRPLGVDIFCLGRKYLIFNMVSKNLKVKYRRSILGVMWTLIVPLATAAIYYFVFQVLMNVKTENYLVTILAGILPWSFFAQSLNENVVIVVENHALATKVPIPVHSLPLIGVISHFITLVLSLPVIVLATYVDGVGIHLSIIMFFVYAILLCLISYSASTILAIGYAYLRDLKHAVGVFVNLWFFGTPILYTASMIPEKHKWVLYANPVGLIFDGFQRAVVQGEFPPIENFLISVGWTFAFLTANVLITKKYGRKVVEML